MPLHKNTLRIHFEATTHMAATPDVESPRGSLWHRWDPHIHSPGTALNDQYPEINGWESFLSAIEASDPPIRALGITDYFGVEAYEQTLQHQRDGRLAGVGLIFPNIEMRLGMETSKSSAVNVHLLFPPDDRDHLERIKRFLLEFEFPYLGDTFRCIRADLIRLGRAHKGQPALEEAAARSEGANQFKVNLEQLKQALHKHDWVKKNVLIAVAGGGKDGTSGLRDPSASFAAQRKNIEALAHIIFSSNPKQVSFWLGKDSTSVDQLESQYGGRKPCLHGSDAHSPAKVGKPDAERRCWIKGDLKFESLRQVCMEPEERVFIGRSPPRGPLPSNTIREVIVTNAEWMRPSTIPVNAGLVAIIGARGSGKTALADLIATGGYAISEHRGKDSFIHRAKQFLTSVMARLTWESGEPTQNDLSGVDLEDLIDTPRIQYLSQKFVAELCSAEEPTHALLKEIQRVIFNAHPDADRLGTDTFDELLELRLQSAIESRERHRETLRESSDEIITERQSQDGLPTLIKERDESLRNLEKDRTDLKTLIPKGQESRAARHATVSHACEEMRQRVATAKLRVLALHNLQGDVADFRSRRFVNARKGLMEQRADAQLTDADWNNFLINFMGPVDSLLVDRIREGTEAIAELEGSATSDPPIDETADQNISLINESSALEQQTLHLLERELARLQKLVGIDAANARRFTQLADKIAKAERSIVRQNALIDKVQSAGERIARLQERRKVAYAGVFNAIVEQATELDSLYAPLKRNMANAEGALGKLSFCARRHVDMDAWATEGEKLLDLRSAGPFKGKGQLRKAAETVLLGPWRDGDGQTVAEAMSQFLKDNEQGVRAHRPADVPPREWAGRVSGWLYGTEHVTVQYGLQYDGVDVEQLSPGTRGIVLLLLYLTVDSDDERPLLIDQPEENLDPQSIFTELVKRFRDAKKRRQIIIVTHNANLVVNTDADQVIVAQCGHHRSGELPVMTYESGGLENSEIRKHVCDILEGGERAFKERAKRLRVAL